MKRSSTCLIVLLLFLAAIFYTGCGGGSSSGGGNAGGGGSDGISPAPVPTTPIANQISILGKSGYVYGIDAERAVQCRANRQLAVFPSRDTIPAGFTPAAGVIVTLVGTPPLMQITDSEGFFDFGAGGTEIAGSAMGNVGNVNVLIQDPSSPMPPICYPMLPEPLPAAELTNLKIVPPFDESTSSLTLSLIAGQVECFYVIGQKGTEWHPVSDTITWSVSDSSMGTFVRDSGIFVSNQSIPETTTGKVTAQLGSISLNQDLTIIAIKDLGTLDGYIKDKNGDPVVNAIVEMRPTSPSSYFGFGMAIADENGYYQILDVPAGSYTLEVRSLFGGEPLATDTVTIAGPTHKDINLSVVVTSLSAHAMANKLAYKPGETMYLQVSMSNFGSRDVDFAYDSIEFRLVLMSYAAGGGETGGGSVIGTTGGSPMVSINRKGDSPPGSAPGSPPQPFPIEPPPFEGTVVATATAPGGVIQVGRYSDVIFPSTSVALTVPQDLSPDNMYVVQAVITSSQKVEVIPAFVIIGDEPQPVPVPTTPIPEPTLPGPEPSILPTCPTCIPVPL
jgi:hypothetical protein